MKSTSQKRKSSEMQIARGRLKGVLQDLVAPTEDEDDEESEEETLSVISKKSSSLPLRGRPPKPSIEGTEVLEQSKELLPVEPSSDGKVQVQESFVMKLFDRSLDLSKYNERTALYPICRAWMANTPRSPSIKNYRNRKSPSPEQRNDDSSVVLAKLQRGEISSITEMPAPEKAELPRIFKAEFRANRSSSEQETNGGQSFLNTLQAASREELLASHKPKWKGIRENCQKHSKLYQQRYEMNHLILKELFKP